MDDLRAIVARALGPRPTARLVTLDADDLAATDGWAAHVALVRRGTPAPPGTAVVDPLRLPLVEAIADAVAARDPLGAGERPRLRELWRVLAPAGSLVIVVPVPSGWWLKRLIMRHYLRGRAVGALTVAMFAIDEVVVLPGAIVVRAGKSDGLAPAGRRTAAVSQPRLA